MTDRGLPMLFSAVDGSYFYHSCSFYDPAQVVTWAVKAPGISNVLCPAMNTKMWEHPIVQRNLGWLQMSVFVGDFHRAHPKQVVWWGAWVEARSALARRAREGQIDRSTVEHALSRLTTLRSAWNEIVPVEEARGLAFRLLGRHPLRAADAFQLAAALLWARGAPEDHRFLCFDDRLRGAARGEGFVVVEAAM